MRKRRRRIKRRKRKKSKKRRKQSWLDKHYSSSVTNKYTKFTTEVIILLELTWILIEITWFIIDVFLR